MTNEKYRLPPCSALNLKSIKQIKYQSTLFKTLKKTIMHWLNKDKLNNKNFWLYLRKRMKTKFRTHRRIQKRVGLAFLKHINLNNKFQIKHCLRRWLTSMKNFNN